MENKEFYVQVAVKAPLFKTLTYKAGEKLPLGQRVRVPLGKRTVTGVVAGVDFLEDKKIGIRDILEKDENSPSLSSLRMEWMKWMSGYYGFPLGLISDLSFLQYKKFKKKEEEESLLPPPSLKPLSVKLTEEQKSCVESIQEDKGFRVHLIHGVTGSGKTEVYKALIHEQIKKNKQALLLLPEISLTPQMHSRFEESFPSLVSLLHSQISIKQKKEEWRKLLREEKKLLMGPRSSLFCPLPSLGLIVVDEEHDSSYKQEEKFRYHARDCAIVLAKKLNIPIVLGSATPDFSSYRSATLGHYKLHKLKKRALRSGKLPKTFIVDLKEKKGGDLPFWMSPLLFKKMNEVLKKGDQVALFLNRRGQASALICSNCGMVKKCVNCDISLTLHEQNMLLCHYCSHLEKKPEKCSSCSSTEFLEKGVGSQTVEKTLKTLFPKFQVLRVDKDSVSSEEEIKSFIKAVENKEAQILIGTRMISKGLDFPSIKLVGLLMADRDFQFPDFRAEEQGFHTLLQMAGRAGRKSHGEVVIQTFHPTHPIIEFSKNHDYESFYNYSLESRQTWNYPPFSKLSLLRIDSLKSDKGRQFALFCVNEAKKWGFKDVQILGPSPAPLTRIKNHFRFQILIKAKDHTHMQEFLSVFFKKIKAPSLVQLKLDRDPVSLM